MQVEKLSTEKPHLNVELFNRIGQERSVSDAAQIARKQPSAGESKAPLEA
jgi:hypothetical protein